MSDEPEIDDPYLYPSLTSDENDDARREIETAVWEILQDNWVFEEGDDRVDVSVGEASRNFCWTSNPA